MSLKNIIVLLVSLTVPLSAWASLGGDVASVEADRAKMEGSVQTSSADSYTIHQIQTAAGVTVKEYASGAGNVFAVTWQGPFHPDLRQLLGSYYGKYVQAVKTERAQRRGRGPIFVQEDGFVVEIAGHVRAFQGRVYLSNQLPQGMRAEEIR